MSEKLAEQAIILASLIVVAGELLLFLLLMNVKRLKIPVAIMMLCWPFLVGVVLHGFYYGKVDLRKYGVNPQEYYRGSRFSRDSIWKIDPFISGKTVYAFSKMNVLYAIDSVVGRVKSKYVALDYIF